MSRLTYVDFKNGMVSERLRRRVDLQMYANSASLIENAVPLRTGGIRQREGLKRYYSEIQSFVRIIPLSISYEENYVIAFTAYVNGSEDFNGWIINPKNTAYVERFKHQLTSSQLKNMTYVQNYEMLVIAEQTMKPHTLTWKMQNGSRNFVFAQFAPNTVKTVYKDGSETSEYTSTVGNYSYGDFLNTGNYPAGVAFVANRLCFYNFTKCPYGIAMSKPFKYTDFQENVVYIAEKSSVSKSLYLKATELQETKYSSKGTHVGKSGTSYTDCYKKEETTVSTAGYYVTTVSIVDEEANVKESYIETKNYRFSKDSTSGLWTYSDLGTKSYSPVYYAEDEMVQSTVITEECSIRLELASDRDETICWLGQVGEYVYIGTTSSEWIMPSSVTAIQVQCSKLSSYGSANGIGCTYGMRNMFYVQSGGNRIRSIQYGENGMSFMELSYQCPELFSKGIVEIAWQKTPEPRLYVRCKDEPKVLYVLCYDADYGVNAWCKWTFDSEIKGMAVIDSDGGQIMSVIADRYIEIFEDGVFKDDRSTNGFVPILRTNNLDSAESIAFGKKNYDIYADTDGTKFKACSYSTTSSTTSPIQCRNVNSQLSKIEAYSQYPNNQGVRIEIRGNGGERFALLALIIDLEVVR